MNTVIVYGPQGCGKTRNAEALMKHFGCTGIEDDWALNQHVRRGALHLTSESAEDIQIARCHGLSGQVISFEAAMEELPRGFHAKSPDAGAKPTNPKDGVGVKKWRQYATVPATVVAEVGVAMLEGHIKGYRRHNFRVAGVRASIYYDAARGHIDQWWEGEDFDPDVPGGRMSHITKAIASLVVLRDAMIQNMLNDDRPPKGNLAAVRSDMQITVDALFEKYPNGVAPYTEIGEQEGKAIDASKFAVVDGNLSNIQTLNGGSESQRLVPRRAPL